MSTPQKTIEGRLEKLPLASDWRDSLESRMRGLRGQVVRLLWLRALSLAVIGCVLAVLAAVAIDWSLRPSGAIGRWGLSGALAAALGGVAWWFIWSTPRRRISLLAVARRLERLIPSLGDRLSSAVAMVDGGSDHGGKFPATDLVGEAVRRAATDLQAARPERTIARGPTWRMALIAAVILGSLIAACWWRPTVASLAARRLFAPGDQVAWPQRHELRLENVPRRVHAGRDVDVFVHDQRGQLPLDTEVLVRDSEGKVFSPLLRMSGKSAAAKIEEVTRDFEIRARGGDDNTMPWRTVRVTAAPAIEAYHVRLLPPAYSGREPQTLVGERIRVLAGTQMWIEATVTPPIVVANFVRISTEAGDERHDPSADVPTSWPASIGAGGRSVVVGPITLNHDGRFAFEWVDTDGLAGESHEQWRIEVEEDAAPRVVITEPDADLEITPTGSVDLALSAEDDLGLAESWFEIDGVQNSSQSLSGNPLTPPLSPAARGEREQKVPLRGRNLGFRRGSQVIRLQVERYETSRLEATTRTRLRIEDLWSGGATEESPSAMIAPGQILQVTGVATDIAGGRGESTIRRLRIISPEKLQQNLARNQHAAMEQLRKAAREQTIAVEQTEAARGRLFGDAEQTAAAEDRLRAADAAQSTVERRIEDGPQSALEQLRSALQSARDNDLDTASLEQLLDRIESIADEDVQPAGDQLDRSREAFAAGDHESARESMDGAIETQHRAAQRLEAIVDTMRRQDARRAALEQLGELAAAQSRLGKASREIADAADPGGEASRLAQRQRELARDAEAMLQRLQQLAEELEQQDPPAADAAQNAAETLQQGASESRSGRRAAAADTMRAAATELERGREGRAAEMQSEAAEQLATARRQMSGQTPTPGDPFPEEPGQRFASRVEQLREDQESLVEALQSETDTAMAGIQGELADRAAQVAADATAPPGFSEALGDVAGEMRTAAALLRRRGSEAAAVDQAEAALERLNFIAESLQEGMGQGPADGAPEREPPEGNGQPRQAAEEDPSETVPLATLRLVRSTQDFLRRRTEQIAAAEQRADDADPLSRARTAAAKRALAEEQERLVERIEQYAREMAESQANPPEESDATTN